MSIQACLDYASFQSGIGGQLATERSVISTHMQINMTLDLVDIGVTLKGRANAKQLRIHIAQHTVIE